MKNKVSIISWLTILVTTTIMAGAAVAQPGPPGGGQGQGTPQPPPPEAIEACQGKAQNATCQINTPQGTITGTCMAMENQLVCAPEGGPPQDGGQGGPPR